MLMHFIIKYQNTISPTVSSEKSFMYGEAAKLIIAVQISQKSNLRLKAQMLSLATNPSSIVLKVTVSLPAILTK